MNARVISTIYFFLISTIGIVLLIIGIYNAINFIVNTTQYDKYPLRYGGVERCSFTPVAIDSPTPDRSATGSPVKQPDAGTQRKDCLDSLEMERKQHKVDDIKNSIAFTLIGGFLFAVHFPIALKRSRNA